MNSTKGPPILLKNHINMMIPCLFYTNWGFTNITQKNSKVWVISPQNPRQRRNNSPNRNLRNPKIPKLNMISIQNIPWFWSSSPSPSSSSSSSSFLPSSPLLQFFPSKKYETNEFCLSQLSFYAPIFHLIAKRSLITLILQDNSCYFYYGPSLLIL